MDLDEEALFGPQDPAIAAAVRQAALDAGGEFGTGSWAACVLAEKPRETIIICAVDPAVVSRSKNRPTGIQVVALRAGHVVGVRIEIMLLDDPLMPLRLAPVLNPAAEHTRDMMRALAAEPVWRLVFLDERDGGLIGQRMLPCDISLRHTLEQILEMTEGLTVSEFDWARSARKFVLAE